MAELSLRRALTRQLMVALLGVAVVGAVVTYLLANRYANQAYDHELLEDAAVLAQQLTWRDGRVQVDLPPAARALLFSDRSDQVRYRIVDVTLAQVVDGNGQLGAWTVPGPQPAYRTVILGRSHFRIAALRVALPPAGRPVLIEVGETLHKRAELAGNIVGGVLLLMIAMALTTVALVRRGIRRTLQPLQQLEAEAAQRSSDNLAPLDPALAPQEVRRLIDAINRMMARLADSIAAQRRFVANAAHQLRTPLAGLRLQAELARKADAALRADLIRDIEQSASRTAHVIEQLLTLSKAESDSGDFNQTLDLADLARRVTERFVPRALDRDVDLGFEGPVALQPVRGNAVLLEELLANLIDNALRYGGRLVTVSVHAAGRAPELAVSDDGPGIPPAARQAVFQRFYRSDAGSGPGAGLGLAIVQEIAQRHGAIVTLDSGAAGGCTFRVRFPPAEGVQVK